MTQRTSRVAKKINRKNNLESQLSSESRWTRGQFGWSETSFLLFASLLLESWQWHGGDWCLLIIMSVTVIGFLGVSFREIFQLGDFGAKDIGIYRGGSRDGSPLLCIPCPRAIPKIPLLSPFPFLIPVYYSCSCEAEIFKLYISINN